MIKSTECSVAIITRTKDRPLFLKRAIESVHSQTYKDFLHVIINDGGDSRSVDRIIDSQPDYIKERISVIHNAASSGMEAASNKAIKSSKSKYVAIHDDDDTWHEDFLDLSVGELESNPDVGGVVVRTNKIVEEVHGESIKILKTSQWMPHLTTISLYRQCFENQMTPITFVYRRSVYKDVGYYDESLPVCGDWDFGIRFIQKYEVSFIDPGYALANYHHRKFKPGTQGNTSYSSGKEKHRHYVTKLANKYLRAELSEGRIGVGYIMSKTKFEDEQIRKGVKRLIPGLFLKLARKG